MNENWAKRPPQRCERTDKVEKRCQLLQLFATKGGSTKNSF